MGINLNKLNSKMQDKVDKKINSLADKASDKLLKSVGYSPELTQDNLVKACKLTGSWLKLGDINETRVRIIKNMEIEVALLLKSGMSYAQVFSFYWDTPEFVAVWGKLGLNGDNLRTLIDDAYKNKREE